MKKRVYKFTAILLLVLLLLMLAQCTVSDTEAEDKALITGTVTYVIDGDTFMFMEDGATEEVKVRMIGVDAPESVHRDLSKNTEAGKLASDFRLEELEGRTVDLELDVQTEDKYGRLLAYVWLEEVLFNKTLLDEGYAELLTIPPNVKYVDYLQGK